MGWWEDLCDQLDTSLTEPERILRKAQRDSGQIPQTGANQSDMWAWLRGALGALGTAIVNGLSAIGTWLYDNLIRPLASLLAPVWEYFRDTIAGGAASIVSTMLSVAKPSFPVDVARPLAVLGSTAAMFISVTAAIKMVDVLHPMKNIVGDSVIALTYGFMGFNMLSSAFWRPIMDSAVGEPLQHWARGEFRPTLIDCATADHMLFEGAIPETEWRQVYAWHGWPDNWIDAHYDEMDREPSVMDMVRIADNVALDEDWARQQLGQAQFRAPEIDKILEAVRRRPLMDEIKIVRQEAMRNFAKGLVRRADLELMMRALGHKEQESALLLQAADIMRARQIATDLLTSQQDQERADASELKAIQKQRVTVFREAYARDLISREDLVQDLVDLAVNPDMVGAIVELEDLKKIPKPKRERLII